MNPQDPGSSLPLPVLKLPPIIGHRGAAAQSPENTLAGLRRAKALGCTWVEFDVRLTADGALVLCHDARLDRTTDRTGRVAAQSLATVRQCDAGSWCGPAFAGEPVPTLEEALAMAAELGLGANVEVKADRRLEYATAAATADIVNRLGPAAPDLLVSSFLSAVLAVLRDLAPQAPRGLLFRSVPTGWAAIARRLGCVLIGADHRRLRPRHVAEVRAAGYPVAAYTVNDPARAHLLFGWGVSSVFSDMPDLMVLASAADDLTWPTLLRSPEAARSHQGALQ